MSKPAATAPRTLLMHTLLPWEWHSQRSQQNHPNVLPAAAATVSSSTKGNNHRALSSCQFSHKPVGGRAKGGKPEKTGSHQRKRHPFPATLNVSIVNVLWSPIQLALDKFNINHMCLTKNKREKNNILNSMDILLEKHMTLDKIGEDCPFNQAELLCAAYSIGIPSWVQFQELKIHIFPRTWPQTKASYPEAQTSKQHPMLFFKHTNKHVISQDPCTCYFHCLGGFPPKISIWSTWLIPALSSYVYIKVIFSLRSSLILQSKHLSTLQHIISFFSALLSPISLNTI